VRYILSGYEYKLARFEVLTVVSLVLGLLGCDTVLKDRYKEVLISP
jgi:hypothetical protein